MDDEERATCGWLSDELDSRGEDMPVVIEIDGRYYDVSEDVRLMAMSETGQADRDYLVIPVVGRPLGLRAV